MALAYEIGFATADLEAVCHGRKLYPSAGSDAAETETLFGAISGWIDGVRAAQLNGELVPATSAGTTLIRFAVPNTADAV